VAISNSYYYLYFNYHNKKSWKREKAQKTKETNGALPFFFKKFLRLHLEKFLLDGIPPKEEEKITII
jgi:hypothetical protein